MIFWTLVLGAGIFFRFYHLGLESLWLDEGYSIEMARRTVMETLRLLPQDLHPPLYTLSLHAWIQVFGDSEIALRAFSAFFGVLLIPLVYRLARHLFDASTARYAALFTSLSLFHVYYSQEARPYTFLIFLTVLSFYFFVRLLESGERKYQAGYLFFTICMLYTHTFGVFTVFAQNLIFLSRFLFRRGRGAGFLNWMLLQAALVFLWMPWIFITWKFGSGMKDNWIGRPDAGALLEALRQYAGGMRLLVLCGALSLWGLWDSVRKKQTIGAEALAVWAAVVFLTPFLVSLVWVPIFYPRYMIASTIPLLIFTGRGLSALPSGWTRRLAAAALIFFCLNGLYQNDKRVDKDQWREAVGVMKTRFQPNDLVIIYSRGEAVFDYYLKRKDVQIRTFPIMKDAFSRVYSWESIYVTPENVSQLVDMTRDHTRVWLVQNHNYDEEGLADKKMAQLYGPPALRRSFTGIVLSLYEKGSGPQA